MRQFAAKGQLDIHGLMLAIVAHDAGGAEILSSYVRRNKLDCILVLEGPALKIFERKLGAVTSAPLTQALSEASTVLCGGGWLSDLEFNALTLARSIGKPCAAFIDHWVFYAERFVRSGATCLPDEIWVGDKDAEVIADRTFPGLPVRLVENPYFQDIRDELNAISTVRTADPARISVLYICEPIRQHALMQHGDERYWGYTEEEALRYFLSNVAALHKAIEQIVIRPHPTEDAGKYLWAQAEFDLPIVTGSSHPLIEEVAASDVVVGCESMAMVVGLLAKKRVISCIPPGGRACALPQAEIQHLQKLV